MRSPVVPAWRLFGGCCWGLMPILLAFAVGWNRRCRPADIPVFVVIDAAAPLLMLIGCTESIIDPQ